MLKRNIVDARFLVFIGLYLLLSCMPAVLMAQNTQPVVQQQPLTCMASDSVVVKFLFRRAISTLDVNYLDNSTQLSKLIQYFSSHPEAKIMGVTVCASSSPEGNVQSNDKLAFGRAETIRNYLCKHFPDYFTSTSPFVVRYRGEDWQGTVEAVKQSSIAERDLITQIIATIADPTARKDMLRTINNGAAWDVMYTTIFPYLRAAEVKIFTTVQKATQPLPAEQPQAEEVSPVLGPGDAHVTYLNRKRSDYMQYYRNSEKDDFRPIIAFKTNLLMDGATALNLEPEVALGRHFSLSLPVYYNPFLFSDKFTLKTLAIQPEFRYWFKRAMKGHFIGLHGVGGYYNLYLPGDYRYQDKDGKTPCYGGGISYGYSVNLSKHWALEFTIGAGYIHFDYDRFDRVSNGKIVDTKVLNYFGPTKAGITLGYIIGR